MSNVTPFPASPARNLPMTIDRALEVVADEKGRTFGDLVMAAEVLAQAVMDLRGDLRMVRSGRDTFHRLLDKVQSDIVNRRRGHPKKRAPSGRVPTE